MVNSLRVIAPELPFPIEYMELTEPEHSIDFEGFRIEAFRVNHNVVCYGYSIIIERSGRFQLDKAQALNIPKQYWSRLQKGGNHRDPGKRVHPGYGYGASQKRN